MKPTLQLDALVNTFWTTWNILKLWYCKGPKSGQDEVTKGDKLTGKLDVAEFRTRNRRNLCRMCLQKSQASESSNDAGVFSKASFVIKQERSECSDDRCCDWCHSPPAFLVHESEVWVFQHEITTPAALWKPWLLQVVPNQLEHGQDSSCPPVLSDTQPYWPRKHEVQGTFKAKSLHELMNQLLGHRTLVTLRSSPRQDDENLNLVSSCVGHAETALVSSTCRVTAQSFQQVTCRHFKHGFV